MARGGGSLCAASISSLAWAVPSAIAGAWLSTAVACEGTEPELTAGKQPAAAAGPLETPHGRRAARVGSQREPARNTISLGTRLGGVAGKVHHSPAIRH